jgi:DNA-binding MarR family transcriptional regulator
MNMTALTKSDFEARSEFRYRLTCFLRFGEQVASAEGLTLAQYQLLLHTKGMKGRSWALIGELAERMQLRHHSAVELVTRCEGAGLVERRRSDADRREVQVHLTPAGERVLRRAASAQTEELSSLVNGMKFDQSASAHDACRAIVAEAKGPARSTRSKRTTH